MKTLLSEFSSFSILALVLFLFFSFTQSVVWLDENHKKSTKEEGVFYRPIPEKKRSGYFIVDYYKNGKKYREGKAESTVIQNETFKGFVTYFYKDGSISKKVKYNYHYNYTCKISK